MCSIFGMYNACGDPTTFEQETFAQLRKNAMDRGRDGGRVEVYRANGTYAALGNWRATPTPEVEKGNLQPYDGIVHNGTIANAEELGLRPGEIDSEVLPRVLDRSSIARFKDTLRRIKGSFAIAAWSKEQANVFLACNFKPIYVGRIDDHGTIFFSSMARHFNGLLGHWHAPVKMQPYSILNLRTRVSYLLTPNDAPKRVLVICSAGLDSVTVATHYRNVLKWPTGLIHFQYGCLAETKESALIPRIAQRLSCDEYHIQPLPRELFGASSLFVDDGRPIASGIQGAEYPYEWVNARNLVMLSVATAYAEAHGYTHIALGNNLEEAGSYPDNEEEFTYLFNNLLPYATKPDVHVQVESPVGHLMKHEIVAYGLLHSAPYDLSWSCYRNGEKPCGRCGPCFMRNKAFARNGAKDPLTYEDEQ